MINIHWPILFGGLFFIVIGSLTIAAALRFKKTGFTMIARRHSIEVVEGENARRTMKGSMATGIILILLGLFLTLIAILLG